MKYSIWDITFVGLTMVFSIFVILFFIFIAMSYITKLTEKSTERVKIKEIPAEVEDHEVVAAIVGALSMIIERPYKIVRISSFKKRKREWTAWIRKGWKGVRKWSEDIE